MRRRSSSLLLSFALVANFLPSAAVSAQEADDPTDPALVISQVYGGGGNSGATLTHDFIEVFNAGDTAADLSDWSVQYASRVGDSWQVTPLGEDVTLEPGGYLYVQQAAGTGGTVTPDPDVEGTIAMAGGSGKVALVDSTDALTGSCPLDDTVDFVGYGTANCSEGTGTAPELSNTTAALRADDGCTDTDDNAADFTAQTPDPRNSDTTPNPCGGPPPPAPVVATCDDLTVVQGQSGAVTLSASDADGTVTDAQISDGAVDGITLVDTQPADEAGGTLTTDLTAAGTLDAGTYPVTVTFTNDDDPAQTADCDVTVSVQGDICEVAPDAVTPINEIQGSGSSTPLEGETVVTRGVVTTDFTSGGASDTPANQGFRGFHIEALAEDRDQDPATSEGLFVFDGSGTFAPEIGTLVHVEGTAGEAFDITQIDATAIQVCDEAPDALPAPAELPLPTPVDQRDTVFEPFESMRVVHDELTVVEFFQVERFGEIRLSSDGVLQNPTNVVEPGSDAYDQLVASNAANNIVLDDGRTGQNLDPLPYVEPGETLRIGDTVSDVPAVLHFAFDEWRLQPVDIDELTQAFQDGRTRPRPQELPDLGDGSVTVAAFNVLNYFNGDGYFLGDDPATAEGFPTDRGAVTVSEFERQTEKIVDAIVRMEADVLALIEIENDGGDDQAAAALVDAVNTELGEDVYDYVDTGQIGTDAIKLAYIYDVDTVEPTGDFAVLDSDVDERFDDTRSRPVLAQTFTELATGESFTVANNHLKSKGSSQLSDESNPNFDQGDGQGFWNATRTAAAEAMADWLATDPTGVESSGTAIVGDLNSYAMEDPIEVLRGAGYVDLLDEFAPAGTQPYTYTFDATQGYLDHALADADLLPFVTGAAAWNINADEVPAIDYQEDAPGRFRTADVAERFYDPSAFRSSDHDPVLFRLDLGAEDTAPGGDDDPLACDPDAQLTFPDVPATSVHARAIACTDALELLEGKVDGRFDPTGSLTRGQAATILARAADAADVDLGTPTGAFPDGGDVHGQALSRLAGADILLGFEDGTARPSQPVTRGQLATLVVRFVERATGDRLEIGAPFNDVTDAPPHDLNIRRARAAGIVEGKTDDRFAPRDDVQRDQAASILARKLPLLQED